MVVIIVAIVIAFVILYLLAVMPRMVNRPDRSPFMGVLYAHRGLHDNEGDAPENSIKALENAVEAGYGVELDVQLSKDKIPVVFHDFTLKRVCGVEGKVSDYTYDQLQQFRLFHSKERIPSLEEFLKLVDGKVPLIVELKIEWTDASVCERVDELLRRYHGVYCIESFNPLGLIWYRKHRSDVMRGQLSDVFWREEGLKGSLYFALEHLLLNFVTKPDFIAYNHKYHRMLSRQICKKLYRSMAVAWTIKTQQQLDARRNDFDLFIFDSFIPENEE